LHTLLSNAAEPGPYVLVGHSLGGKHVRLFASSYPAEVSGMVLVDARHEDVDASLGPAIVQRENAQTEQFRTLEVSLRRLGITRALGPWLVASAPPDVRGLPPAYFLFQGESKAAEANLSEIQSYAESDAQLRMGTGSLGDKPLIVLMRGKPIEDPTYWSAWQAAQVTMLGLSTRSQLVVAQDSGHVIQLEQPELVIAAVGQTIDTIRSDAQLEQ
jgi:pimeloyl-ACP methyl ester carboxylesterase